MNAGITPSHPVKTPVSDRIMAHCKLQAKSVHFPERPSTHSPKKGRGKIGLIFHTLPPDCSRKLTVGKWGSVSPSPCPGYAEKGPWKLSLIFADLPLSGCGKWTAENGPHFPFQALPTRSENATREVQAIFRTSTHPGENEGWVPARTPPEPALREMPPLKPPSRKLRRVKPPPGKWPRPHSD